MTARASPKTAGRRRIGQLRRTPVVPQERRSTMHLLRVAAAAML